MSLKRIAAAFVGAVVAVWSAGSPAQAEDFRLLTLGERYVKWGAAEFATGAVVTYGFADRRSDYADAINCGAIGPIDPLLQASHLTRTQFAENVREALGMWHSAANVTFQYTEDATKAQILIGAQGTPIGIAFANVWHDGTGHHRNIASITKATVCLNPLVAWKAASDDRPETYYLRHVIAHEVGHTIGLDHPGRTGQLMGYRYSEDTTKLGAGDVRGAVTLYGPAK